MLHTFRSLFPVGTSLSPPGKTGAASLLTVTLTAPTVSQWAQFRGWGAAAARSQGTWDSLALLKSVLFLVQNKLFLEYSFLQLYCNSGFGQDGQKIPLRVKRLV